MKLRFKERVSSILLYLGIPRLLRFASLNPEWVNINVTENCNSKCITCHVWKNKSAGELTTEEIKDAMHQLRKIEVKHVIFIGGEPLLRNDIGDLIKEATLLGFETRMLVTNGLLLETKAKELLENGLTHLSVSIDGLGRANDVIRGVPSSYEKSIRGIEAVQKLKEEMGSKLHVTILTTILLNQNVADIPKLIEASRSLGVHWTCNLLDPNLPIFQGIPFSDLIVKNEEKIDTTIDYLKKTRRENPELITSCDHVLEYARYYLKTWKFFPPRFHCVHGYKLIWIDSHGNVYPGCWLMQPIGNLRKDKLQDVLKSETYRKSIKRMYMNECLGCTNLHAFNIATMHLLSHQIYCSRRPKKGSAV
jgi:MoaA/NifB/PqqE/SkfB family radical SAM enzyme